MNLLAHTYERSNVQQIRTFNGLQGFPWNKSYDKPRQHIKKQTLLCDITIWRLKRLSSILKMVWRNEKLIA